MGHHLTHYLNDMAVPVQTEQTQRPNQPSGGSAEYGRRRTTDATTQREVSMVTKKTGAFFITAAKGPLELSNQGCATQMTQTKPNQSNQ